MIILGCSPIITSLLCRCVPVCLSVSTWRVLHWSVNVDNGCFPGGVRQVSGHPLSPPRLLHWHGRLAVRGEGNN